MNDMPEFPLPRTIPAGVRGGARPSPAWLQGFPDGSLTAKLMCSRTSRTLVGVVLQSFIATAEERYESLGEDFFADCQCGWSHGIDGTALRGAVTSLPARRLGAKPPIIWVQKVERPAGNPEEPM